MRILGLDHGERRIGVAVSDATGTIATPHSVIDRRGEDVPEALRSIIDRVRGSLHGSEVPDDELLEAERRLLAELNRNTEEPTSVRFCAGDGRPRRRGTRLLMPRNNPLIAGAARLVAADDRWVYPAAAALLGEDLHPTADLRSSWTRRILG